MYVVFVDKKAKEKEDMGSAVSVNPYPMPDDHLYPKGIRDFPLNITKHNLEV